MCLLVVQPASAPSLTQEWLEDFYSSNADGVGIMRSVDGELLIEKILPKNAQEFVEFYNNHIDGYDCAFHLRMKTHGNIDMENCHPYEVFNSAEHGLDVWLMHNGILGTGNAGDVTKSDTWHYIRDYLRPMLANNLDFAFTDAFAEIVGDHIGASNKFVIMDSTGRVQTVNQTSGVYWGGRWLSNTYAWASPTGVPKDYVDSAELAVQQIEAEPYKAVWKTSGSKSYKQWTGGYGASYGAGGYDSRYDSDDYWEDYKYNHITKTYDKVETTDKLDRPVYVPPVGNIFEDEDGDYADEDNTNRSPEYGVSPQEIEDVMEDLLFEIEQTFEIKYLSRVAGAEFIEEFGIDNFMEVCYMALDDMIDSSWFQRILTDHICAREAFPWIERTKPQKISIC